MSMKSFFKKLPILILIGIGIGVPIGIMSALATEEQLQVITPILTLIIVAAVILIFSYTILKAIKFNKEVNRLLKILYEDIDIENYIKETREAISKTRDESFKLHFSLNLAVGYNALGKYEEAIHNMRVLDIGDARWVYKALYYNNLAFFYYEAGNSQEAIQTYSDGEKFIDKLLKNPIYSAGPLHTKGIIEYCKGNFTSSEELLEQSKLQINANNYLVTSANLYIAKICLQTGRTPKAKILLDYNLSQKLFPNVLAQTKNLVEEMNSRNS